MKSNHVLPTLYQQFIHQTRYAKWLVDENRRETWSETIDRYTNSMVKHLTENHNMDESNAFVFEQVNLAIKNLEVMPSMRALMTSGPALDRDHIAGFNCSFIPVDHPRAFDEMVYILMCGTGVGFSVERQQVAKLPTIPDILYSKDTVIQVQDSKMGWAKAVKQLVSSLYAGNVPELDVSKVRPAGAPLKTFGGRASGPKPLVDLYNFMVRTFQSAVGRKLTSVECHDICCKIGDVVVSGGVRRSALISLSNLSDQRMREAKSGLWWEGTPWRRLANNSVAYTERPDVGQWMDEWNSIYQSKSGERGVFNREAAIKQCQKFNRKVEDIHGNQYEFGVNPCGEIILRPLEFCNLSEVIARQTDTVRDLEHKVRIATIIGTYQSSLTNYRYIRQAWKDNSEEECLLGVSFTGIMDCPLLNGKGTSRAERNRLLSHLRNIAVTVNANWARKFGINKSAAITCVKPSGTVSQLTDSSSGIHSRFASQYIRTARNDVKDPITQFLLEQGVQGEEDVMNSENIVFSFPITSPEDCITRNDRSALEELENWLDFKTHWCQHNPSVTINVREHEWPAVGAWVWQHFDDIAGVSFLPHSDHIYQQAPYQDATVEEVKKLAEATPNSIDWSLHVEEQDETTGTQELACSSGVCEI